MDAPVPPPPAPALCWDCRRALEPADRYCRVCGQGQGEWVAWYYRRWGIALATLFGLGPFGLILVKRTPVMESGERWAWAGGILGLTAWVGWRLYQALRMLSDALRLAGGLG